MTDAILVVMMLLLKVSELVISFMLEGSGLRFLLLLLAVEISGVVVLRSP